ncbi:MAG: GAF domain-containing protein [FCB group bacterium]|nr:GAF domain-containing protein [FCB group bacterium]
MTRREIYEQLLHEIPLLIGAEGKYAADLIGKMALFSAAVKRRFPDLIFIGFYIVKDQYLHIGPYQGDIIACTPIAFGSGVCGKAAADRETLIVNDVCDFPGYIACDSETRSEIVLPVVQEEELIAVLDIDSGKPGRFDDLDQHYLELLLKIVFDNSTS